ncbi:MAG: SDR family NAD(P)-dependent oxidoreductase [Litorimonas sp.]
MQDRNGKNIVVTGVSSGIGRETARCLAKKGYCVFGSVRKAADSKPLEDELGERFHTMVFDVCDTNSIIAAAANVSKIVKNEGISAVINNAGLALFGPIELIEDDAFEHIMKVNVLGARFVTNAFLPVLRLGNTESFRSKIVNISSLSGIFNTPMNGAYCVSKHAMESLGEIYRRELLGENIDVVAIRSGPIQSEIWRKNIEDTSQYEDTVYAAMANKTHRIMHHAKKSALPPSVIAELVWDIIEDRKKKHSYHVGEGARMSQILSTSLMPRRLADKLIHNALTKKRKKKS